MQPPNAMHIPHMLIPLVFSSPKAPFPPPHVPCTIMHRTKVLFLLAACDVLSVIVTTKIGESAKGHGRTGRIVAGEFLGVREDVAYDLVAVVGGTSGRGR